jgi:DHA1 family multidrug resistance protein-like MFS transporter
MAAEIIRDAPIGQLLRWVTRNRILQYPEERPDFKLPLGYGLAKPGYSSTSDATTPARTPAPYSPGSDDTEKANLEPAETRSRHPSDVDRLHLERMETAKDTEFDRNDSVQTDLEKATTNRSHLSRTATRTALEAIHTRAEFDEAFRVASLARGPTQPIVPERTHDGLILVDFYTTDDPANPQNWTLKRKGVATLQICLYTLAVYMGSAIYAPSISGVQEEFGVSITVASLGLALYVLAYGIGPLIFSPISEIPVIGRNPPYMITMGIFVALCLAAPLVDNIAGLLVVRFLQGFFGSPCLATGGASLGDMFSIIKLPYVLGLWALSATCGPALGPIISGFSVTAKNWRWSLWEMLWLSGPIFIMMLLFLPETFQANILLRRAKRLRKLTGNDNYRSQSELDQAALKPRDVLYDALVRPIQLMVLDPAIGFTAAYVGLCYGIYYSFFEAFPIVYIERYHFTLGEMGLTFLSITAATLLSLAMYYLYVYKVVEPDFRAHGIGRLERRLIPALYASFLLPIGLFIFAWTSDGKIHWIVSVVGVFLFTIGGKHALILRKRVTKTIANRSISASLHPDASHLRLPPDGLPAIRGQSVRRQRFRSLERGFRGYHVQQADVLRHGHRTGRESTWSSDCGLYIGHLCALLLWREPEGEESIRCKIRWDGAGWFG